MKKIKITILSILLLVVVTACGCTTWKSFTYNVKTGDKIKVQLKTGNGYNISSDVPFKISKNGEVLSKGSFIKLEYYDQYVDAALGEAGAIEIERSSKDNISYVFYSNNGSYEYIIKVNNSNTGLVIENSISESSAREVFDRITISKEK